MQNNQNSSVVKKLLVSALLTSTILFTTSLTQVFGQSKEKPQDKEKDTITAPLPNLITAKAYIGGIDLGTAGIFKLKQHKDEPIQAPMKGIILPFETWDVFSITSFREYLLDKGLLTDVPTDTTLTDFDVFRGYALDVIKDSIPIAFIVPERGLMKVGIPEPKKISASLKDTLLLPSEKGQFKDKRMADLFDLAEYWRVRKTGVSSVTLTASDVLREMRRRMELKNNPFAGFADTDDMPNVYREIVLGEYKRQLMIKKPQLSPPQKKI